MKCVDTSFLIEAEHNEALRQILDRENFVVPAMAAAEFLLGIRLVKSERIRQHAQTFYDDYLRPFVFSFDESQAQHLATLIATQRSKGRTLKPFDAAIAAAALELNCPILAGDSRQLEQGGRGNDRSHFVTEELTLIRTFPPPRKPRSAVNQ